MMKNFKLKSQTKTTHVFFLQKKKKKAHVLTSTPTKSLLSIF